MKYHSTHRLDWNKRWGANFVLHVFELSPIQSFLQYGYDHDLPDSIPPWRLCGPWGNLCGPENTDPFVQSFLAPYLGAFDPRSSVLGCDACYLEVEWGLWRFICRSARCYSVGVIFKFQQPIPKTVCISCRCRIHCGVCVSHNSSSLKMSSAGNYYLDRYLR